MKKLILISVAFIFLSVTTNDKQKETSIVQKFDIESVRNQILKQGRFSYNFGNGFEGELSNLKTTEDVTFENAPMLESYSYKGNDFVMVDDNQSVIYINDTDYTTQTQSEVLIVNDPKVYRYFKKMLIDDMRQEHADAGIETSYNENGLIIRRSINRDFVAKQFGKAQDTISAGCGTPPRSSQLSFTTFSEPAQPVAYNSDIPIRPYWRVILYTNGTNVNYWDSVRRTMESWRSLTPDSPNTPNSMNSLNGSYYGVRSPLPLRFSLSNFVYNNDTNQLTDQLEDFRLFVLTVNANQPYPYQRTFHEYIRPSGWEQARGQAYYGVITTDASGNNLRVGVNSTSSSQCLAHEIGHNLNMEHDTNLYNNSGDLFVDVMNTPLGDYLDCPSSCVFGCGSWPCGGTLYRQSHTFNGAAQRSYAKTVIQYY